MPIFVISAKCNQLRVNFHLPSKLKALIKSLWINRNRQTGFSTLTKNTKPEFILEIEIYLKFISSNQTERRQELRYKLTFPLNCRPFGKKTKFRCIARLSTKSLNVIGGPSWVSAAGRDWYDGIASSSSSSSISIESPSTETFDGWLGMEAPFSSHLN